MGMTVNFDPALLEAAIRNITERASHNASRTMQRAAIRIRDLARDYAPEKSGALERAIDYGTIKDPGTRRNVYVVYVDLDMASGKHKRVGDYAWLMEEGLENGGSGRYKLGDISMQKLWSGKKVGGKFLQRAIEVGTDRIIGDVAASVASALGGRLINMNYGAPGGQDE